MPERLRVDDARANSCLAVARKAAAAPSPILYERPDWRLFIDKRTLPQKAGCAPDQLGRVVLKELVDNALDAGAGTVTLTGDATRCTVADDGPGFDPDEVPRLFAVNRPLGLLKAEASADTRNARQRAAGRDGRGRRIGWNDQRNNPRTTLRARY
jgi:hypothetical protein